jgi:hypothetical protein
MANYFPVALTGTARSWLMNLPEGTLDSWPELCHKFTATSRALTPGKATRPTSTLSNSVWGSLCAPSSSGSPTFATPSLVSPMPLLWLHFARGYGMRRCWRRSLPTTSRMSLRCSAELTSAPGPPRAVRGTPRLPRKAKKRASPTPAPQHKVSAARARRRRLAVASRWPGTHRGGCRRSGGWGLGWPERRQAPPPTVQQ